MSMDLNFWRYKEGAIHDNQRIYERACCDGEQMEELETLSMDEIYRRIASAFSDWTALNSKKNTLTDHPQDASYGVPEGYTLTDSEGCPPAREGMRSGVPEGYEKEGRGAFEIFTTSQIVRFDCYGMQQVDMNVLMDILIDFGCPLYDPQISTRFDEWTDR